MTKEWTIKSPYVANAVSRIVKNHGDQVTFVGFRGKRSPQWPPPLICPWLQIHCEVDYIAEQQIKLQSQQLWRLSQFWVDVQTMKPNLWCVSAGNKSSFPFPIHTVVKLFLNDISIFKTKHRYQFQPEDDIRCALKTTGAYFNKLVKQTQRQDSHWNLWTWAVNRMC